MFNNLSTTFIRTYLILSFISLLITSCNREENHPLQTDQNGVVISRPYLWKKSVHSGEPNTNGYTLSPIYYKDNIILSRTKGYGNVELTLLNTDNGETIWDWDDRYEKSSELIEIRYFHQFNNLLYYNYGSRHYCINLNTGKTQWKIRTNSSFSSQVTPFDNFLFNYSSIINSNGYEECIAYKVNIETGQFEEFVRPKLSSEYGAPTDNPNVFNIGGIQYVTKIENNLNQFIISYCESLPEWKANTFFGLYNNLSKKWVWDRKLLSLPSQGSFIFNPPIVFNNKVYANVGHSIVCYDISSGEKVWSLDFNGGFLFSGFIIVDGKLIGNCEDCNTYCINPETGSVYWVEKSAGTCSRMSYLNGIVYFAGGSDECLHALDIRTGKTVWKINLKIGLEPGGAFKGNGVYVLPAKEGKPARVIALSYMNAYCFEAYR